MKLITEQTAEEGKEHIQKYLTQGEQQTVEFKQRLNQPEKIAKTICSLANTAGGTLLIGIRDDKTISGVDPEQEKFILEEALRFYCDPPIPITLTQVFVAADDHPFEEVTVLVVEVDESNQKPHRAKRKKGEWKAYIRHQDKTMIAGSKTEKLLETDDIPNSSKKLSKNQQKLINYLQKHERITQKEFAGLVNISERRARRELIDALEQGAVRVLELEKEDYYIL
ncbi:MAG: putative DNA binding domain-containing protein [Fulvivirga sp.]|nr:putative DNA binding domain-containing protein [Fulvivirga sp.]